jgi:hypothetical protein
MITAIPHNYFVKADGSTKKDCSLGNVLFTLAGIIGVATKNGYTFGFPPWANQNWFVQPLPVLLEKYLASDLLQRFQNPITYKGFDLGFCGFDIPDNSIVNGFFGSWKYFEHCQDMIRNYFTLKDIYAPMKDHIIIHYRDYSEFPTFNQLGKDYYEKALELMPDKNVAVVTNNVDSARKVLGWDCKYISSSPIQDFYILSHADYLIMANSSFSWWGAWLSKAKTIAPKVWFSPEGEFADCPIGNGDFYLPEWVQV